MKRILFAAGLFFAMAGTQIAGAQSRTIIVRQQQVMPNSRSHGYQHSNLSPREARMIEQRKEMLRRERKMALRDGWISPAEQRRLDRLQQQLDLYVFQQSHDRRIR